MVARKENIEFHTKSPIPVVFSALVEPRAFADEKSGRKGEPKYSGTLLFDNDSEDLKAFKDACVRAAKAQWPNLDIVAEVKAKRLRVPWLSGEQFQAKRQAKTEKAGKEYNPQPDEWSNGKVLVRAGSKNQPALGYVVNGKGVDLVDEGSILANKGKFYSGALSFVQLNIVAYEAIDEYSSPGVTAYLQRVLTTGKGEKIGGVRSASETFSAYLGKVSDVNPLDDEIPF
jgi:hypothetical protein